MKMRKGKPKRRDTAGGKETADERTAKARESRCQGNGHQDRENRSNSIRRQKDRLRMLQHLQAVTLDSAS